ncbi:MAG: hypothetical protein JXB05_32890 [Myxococcaceae bacterium]|nr:hypothetical protein [Myxococcaceae bacterium]
MRQILLLLVVLGGLAPLGAEAYPWMIRHGYSSCATCHVDPSGGGMLTPYGRAQSEVLVAAPNGKRVEAGEVSPSTGFFFGGLSMPEWLNLAMSFRGGALINHAGGTTAVRPVQMASDLRAQVSHGPLQAVGTLGFAIKRARSAALTSREENNLVAREYWVGFSSPEKSLLVRAGRMNLPFGLRNPEHTSWVRQATRTDTNDQQQHGLALAYTGERLRGEVMAIAGNFQIHPDMYRERGYSGFLEWAAAPQATVGLSSLVTWARYDMVSGEPSTVRQAHGLFGRWAPTGPLALLAEVDVLTQHSRGGPTALGYAGMLQADLEVTRGVHLITTGEVLERKEGRGLGAGLGAAFFLAPQLEVRVDGIVRRMPAAQAAPLVYSLLTQLHVSL